MTVNQVAGWGSAAVVLVSVACGLWISGTPAESRLEQIDAARVHKLRSLTFAIDAYWQTNGELPARLDDLLDGFRLSEMPVDPESGERFEYLPGDSGSYELCADFARVSRGVAHPQESFWSHGAGRHCFQLAASASRLVAPGMRLPFPNRAPDPTPDPVPAG